MTGFFSGPSLIVHVLIVAMINAFLLPTFYKWSGSILFAFFISIMMISIYGLIVVWLLSRRNG
jgi:hypothetical protein